MKTSRRGTNGRVGSARPGPDAGDDEGDVTTAQTRQPAGVTTQFMITIHSLKIFRLLYAIA